MKVEEEKFKKSHQGLDREKIQGDGLKVEGDELKEDIKVSLDRENLYRVIH